MTRTEVGGQCAGNRRSVTREEVEDLGAARPGPGRRRGGRLRSTRSSLFGMRSRWPRRSASGAMPS